MKLNKRSEEAQKEWDEYFKNRIPPGKLVLTPEQEAIFDNSPGMKKKNEMCRESLTKHPLPWGEVIWND